MQRPDFLLTVCRTWVDCARLCPYNIQNINLWNISIKWPGVWVSLIFNPHNQAKVIKGVKSKRIEIERSKGEKLGKLERLRLGDGKNNKRGKKVIKLKAMGFFLTQICSFLTQILWETDPRPKYLLLPKSIPCQEKWASGKSGRRGKVGAEKSGRQNLLRKVGARKVGAEKSGRRKIVFKKRKIYRNIILKIYN